MKNAPVLDKIILEPAYSIDYLRVSYQPTIRFAQISPDGKEGFDYLGEDKPLKNYKEGFKFRSCRIDVNEQSPTQGSLMTMSGDDLKSARLYGWNDRDVLAMWMKIPTSKITRIDLAIDFSNPEVNPVDIAKAFDKGELKTRAANYQLIYKGDRLNCTGLTVYLGSRTSQIFLRCYRKDLESKADWNWTRVEAEIKGDLAHNTAKAVLTHGVIDVTKQSIRRFVTGVGWLDDATYGTKGRLVRPVERKVSDTEKWVNEVALPAVLKAYAEGNRTVIEAIAGLQGGEILINDPKLDD